ncbi:fluoride efflux transporter CrcB [Listeria fleischmannii]|nr:fluoride efflux transporter CrcB [Listeria fleischmannii]
MLNFLFVGIGAAFGGMTRYGISIWMKNKWKTNFPFATFIINLSGSFLLGLLVSSELATLWQLLLGTGFMGGYTTFSTFKVECTELYLQKKAKILTAYISLSYVLGISFAALGFFVGSL